MFHSSDGAVGVGMKASGAACGISRIFGYVLLLSTKTFNDLRLILGNSINVESLIKVLLIVRFNLRKKIIGTQRLAMKKTMSKVIRFKSVSDSKMAQLKTCWMKKCSYNKM